jgi:protease YdgD
LTAHGRAVRLAIAALAIAISTAAGTGPTSAAERRVPVDPNAPPWNAIVKVQTNIGSRCTGVLIAPSIVLTAAHCLHNPRTQAFLQAVSLHVLLGYERGSYRSHRLVARYDVGRGFEAGKGPQTADWARLQLTEPVPNAPKPLPLAEAEPAPRMAVSLAGYNQDRAQLLIADLSCHVIRAFGSPDGGRLIVHDCAATRGTSGAPLLVRQESGWAVLGINIAAGRENNLALAVSAMLR